MGQQGKLAALPKTKASTKSALPDLSGATTDGKTWLTPAECRRSLRGVFKKYSITQNQLARMTGQNPAMVSRSSPPRGGLLPYRDNPKKALRAFADCMVWGCCEQPIGALGCCVKRTKPASAKKKYEWSGITMPLC